MALVCGALWTLERVGLGERLTGALLDAHGALVDAAKLELERNKRPEQLHAETIAELALRYVVGSPWRTSVSPPPLRVRATSSRHAGSGVPQAEGRSA